MTTDASLTLLSLSYIFIPYSMYNFDQNIKSFSNNIKSSYYDRAFSIIDKFGEGQYHILGYSLIHIFSKIKKNKDLEEFSVNGIKSFLISGALVLCMKTIFGRSRPYMNEGSLSFKPFNLKNDYQSFPSGHTIIAFTTASYLSNKFKNKVFSIFVYSLATGVGLARIYKDQHWLSDVIGGATLGILVGNTVR
ncbi:MAG: phosphatase PAP2 family protein [candidate division WOR-3 bacterium]|nr:phosphatase PAP2 family protein [candidate division WOR-3 bacterium]MDW8151268.1 phosphatase PAP2 family protein [candidate division WOR-3 bacterium]